MMRNTTDSASEYINKQKKKPPRIAVRMFVLLMLFIALIFTAIFAAFTYFMNDYISRDMTNQLENAVFDIKVRFHADIMREIPHMTVITTEWVTIDGVRIRHPVLRLDYRQIVNMITHYIRETNSRTEVNLVLYSVGNYGAEDYARLFPDDSYVMLNLSDMDNLMQIVQMTDITDRGGIMRASNAHGSYYFTNVDLGELFGEVFRGISVALYISTEEYDELIRSIYNMLLIILIAATVFMLVYAIFISRSISKPIRKLCGFADEIGRGNFGRNEYEFRDKELSDLNRRMNETARKLEINDADQKTFFQNVSHELKTPLMSIKGYAEGIKYGIFASETEKDSASDIIIQESERLNDLVADLLYISKMDSSAQKQAEPESANLGDIVESCAQRLRGVLINSQDIHANDTNDKNDKKEIIINHPRSGIYIECNEESLSRAIMNIAANCLRYAKTVVSIEYYESSGNSVILKIRDDGDGIDSQDLPHIFKRFYKGKGGKHGIGLSIAKAIIEQHGAQIHAENRTDTDGFGAEFTIKFVK